MQPGRCIAFIPVCSLLLAATPIQAHEVYAKAGFLGAGIGYSYGFSEYFNVRTDYSTIGTYKRTETANKLKVKAKLKADQLGLYGDWFPMGGAFRFTAGLHQRKLEINAEGKPKGGSYTINNTTVVADPNDRVKGKVEFPDTAPYLGIGWGHQSNKPGFAFIADLGVSFGKAKTKLHVSDSVRNKLAATLGGSAAAADAEIRQQRKELDDEVGGIKIWPQAYVGISYNF